jgi:hypothetical protein
MAAVSGALHPFCRDFRPLGLNRIRLWKGRGELVLRALDAPGQAVVDIRAIKLVRD